MMIKMTRKTQEIEIVTKSTMKADMSNTHQNLKEQKKTSSQSSVDAIDAELQTAELLKLLILLEE